MEEQSYTSTHPLGHIGPVMGSLYLLLTFRRKLLRIFCSEESDYRFLRKFGTNLRNTTASLHRIIKHQSSPLREPKISYWLRLITTLLVPFYITGCLTSKITGV